MLKLIWSGVSVPVCALDAVIAPPKLQSPAAPVHALRAFVPEVVSTT